MHLFDAHYYELANFILCSSYFLYAWFGLILYVPVSNFSVTLEQGGSSWVEPVLS